MANQLLPWMPEPAAMFAQVARVLRKGGVFAFATLGPDSLREIAAAQAAVDPHAHVNVFADMHDVGDGLVRAGLADPVLDVDRLTVRYADAGRLFDDLTRTGARNSLAARGRALAGKARFQRMTEALAQSGSDEGIVLELELVYGHCWGTGVRGDAAEFLIAADEISHRR